MAQQTAIDWLFEQLLETPIDKLSWYAILEQAKQMEKQQIIQAYHRGLFGSMELKSTVFADEYYEQTYNK